MSVLVFGKTGQVATELALLEPNALCLGRDQADLSDPEACVAAIHHHAPSAVINAAAYTAVDKAEDDEDLATRINGHAPGAMARACAERDIPLVQISTDYVFAGTGNAPWTPEDPTGPLGAYGRSKLVGEEAVRAAGGVHVILRTSWVFSAHGNNFLKTMLRLFDRLDSLNVVDDQIGGPTPARAIAAACLSIAGQLKDTPDKTGTYHFAGAPDASWKNFACEIRLESKADVAISGVPTSEYPTPATRPLNSRLDCRALESAFGIARPDWKAATAQIVEQLRT